MAGKTKEVSEFVSFSDMELEHIPEVRDIEEASYTAPWSESAFTYEVLHNHVADYIVALFGNQVIGYAGMWTILDEAHITNIAVAPDWRSRGVGFMLVKELMRRAVSIGLKKMTLEVRPSNKYAISLYKKLGFKEYGLRKRYYVDNNEDAIIMWKFRLGR
ncbi:MAG TPA: ribosomal protein S18-alanine N-acetyltransferase [Clostridia bacterium]|nr:ribosomal protein S18-alanine N-acetyltransferase [Clostridia bacterium]